MTTIERPASFHIDLTGGNGTPFRFVFLPDDGSIWQYDRRHAVQPGRETTPQFNEDGQLCGPEHHTAAFIKDPTGLRGWHGNDDWDVDRATVALVGSWLQHIADTYGLDLT